MATYITFDGSTGYMDTPDVNLLNADNAHCHQSAGQWYGLSGGMTVTGGNDDIDGKWNTASNVLKYVQSSSAGTNKLLTMDGQSGFSGSTVYSMGAWMYSVDQDVLVTPFFRWMTDATTQVGTDSAVSASSVPANTWTWVSLENLTSHASTSHVGFFLRFDSLDPSGDIPVGYTAYMSGVATYQSATASTFVPSFRIVGDLDVRAHIAATDATPVSAETLIGQRSGNSGYAMTIGTGGELVVYYGTGSGTRVETSSGASISDGVATVLRSYFDLSAGTWYHLQDGVQFDSSPSFATTAGSPYAGALAAGADSGGAAGFFDGDVYYVEVRDGIDGPVVARMDAEDWVGI